MELNKIKNLLNIKIYLILALFLVQYCMTPKLLVKYSESRTVEEVKYPINFKHKITVVENDLFLTLTEPDFSNGTVTDYDKESYFEEFNVDKFKQGVLAILFGVNIPILIYEYFYYKLKYPIIENNFKSNFLKDRGSRGSSLPLKIFPIEITNFNGDIIRNDDSIVVSRNLDSFKEEIYNFKRYKKTNDYSIRYNICNDIKSRRIYNLEEKECNLAIKTIDTNELVNAINSSKIGKSLISNVLAKIKEDERQEKLRQQEEARLAKIREQEERERYRRESIRRQEQQKSTCRSIVSSCMVLGGNYSGCRDFVRRRTPGCEDY